MSDLSGPAFRHGFENYVTGYPLPSDGIYCLAKTWFATELPRPGCVWTHTLLLDESTLAGIHNASELLPLFRRPHSEASAEEYENPLRVESLPDLAVTVSASNAEQVLQAIYSTRQRVVLLSEKSSEFEDLVLALFSQQWPRLRRAFSFCTGALSVRESEFDLSVSPPGATHSLGPNGIALDMRRKASNSVDDWVSLAARDLSDVSGGGEFRNFLWQFGPDFRDGRNVFRALTETYLAVLSNEPPLNSNGVLSAVAQYFNRSEDALSLKAALFAKDGTLTHRLGTEEDLLRLLLSHPAAETIPDSVARIAERATQLTSTDPEKATSLALVALDLRNENANQFIEGYVRDARWALSHATSLPSQLVVMLLEREPTLAGNPDLWRRADSTTLLSDLLAKGQASDLSVEKLVHALLSAEAWDTLRLALSYFRLRAVGAILSFFDTQAGRIRIPNGLLDVANFDAALTQYSIDPGELGPQALAVLSAIWDPRLGSVRRSKPQTWLRTASATFDDERYANSSAVFLLALGLDQSSAVGAELVSQSFAKVYSAAKQEQLSERLWHRLDPVLPWFSPSSDKCGRLIRAAARAFVDQSWPTTLFCRTFATADLLLRAINEIKRMWAGSRYLRNLKSGALTQSIGASPEQNSLLARLEIP